MDDWLQLTEEDIARAHRLTRAQPPMPDVVIITPADMTPPSTPSTVPGGDETPALRAAPTAPTLRITLDDLTPALRKPNQTQSCAAWSRSCSRC